MTKLPISVSIVSGAEAHRIGRALQSVTDWTSEIILVINQEVTDGTDRIAQEYGAKVFREPWKGCFTQKNSAAGKARCDWILNLDSDEVVSTALRDEIIGVFSQPEKLAQAVGFSFPRCSLYCGRWIRHGDWYPDRITRLWRRGRGRHAGVDPHDHVEVDGAVMKLHSDLEHYGADSINSRLSKMISFSDVWAAQRAPAGENASAFDLAVRPFWRFVRAYVLRLGFLDGWQGFYIASHMSFAALVRYAKLREYHLRHPVGSGQRGSNTVPRAPQSQLPKDTLA